MPVIGKFCLSLGLLLLFLPSSLQAKDTCTEPSLRHERRDAATVQRLENAWSIAYLRGDTDLERCLLAPDFTEILRTGEVKVFTDELAFAAKNRGKNLAIPDLPKSTVLIHGNVAVAYGTSTSAGADGQPRTMRFADYYVWEDGGWHAFFAQQTQFENHN
jgi:hypothetical protein